MVLLLQGYGMTETCGIISLEYPEKGQVRQFGSTGALVSGVEAKSDDVEDYMAFANLVLHLED